MMAEYNRQSDAAQGSSTGEYGERTQNPAPEYADKAQEYGEKAQSTAQQYGEKAQEQAEKAREQTAGGMERVAEMVRERADGSGGMPAEAGAKAADALESASGYLRAHNTTEMWTDVETFAREHPTQALAGAIVAGFLIGRILR